MRNRLATISCTERVESAVQVTAAVLHWKTKLSETNMSTSSSCLSLTYFRHALNKKSKHGKDDHDSVQNKQLEPVNYLINTLYSQICWSSLTFLADFQEKKQQQQKHESVRRVKVCCLFIHTFICFVGLNHFTFSLSLYVPLTSPSPLGSPENEK